MEYSLWYTGPVETDPGKVALGGGEEADQHPEHRITAQGLYQGVQKPEHKIQYVPALWSCHQVNRSVKLKVSCPSTPLSLVSPNEVVVLTLHLNWQYK